MIGVKKLHRQMRHCISENIVIMLSGPPGVGKTSSTHLMAKEMGFMMHEVNSSDVRTKDHLARIYRLSRMKMLKPTLFLLDEIDGLKDWKALEKIITEPVNPIVLTANDQWKIPMSIKKLLTVIEFKFWQRDLDPLAMKIMKQTGKSVKIIKDARQMLIMAETGGTGYVNKSDFDIVGDAFRKSDFTKIEDKHLFWLHHNAYNFYTGFTLFKVLYLIAQAAHTGRMEFLKGIPQSYGKLEFPEYFKKQRALKTTEWRNKNK